MRVSWFKTPTSDLTLTAKVVIVGSGAGGALAALTLAEAGIDVVVLEEGDHRPSSSFGTSWGETVPALFHEGGMRLMGGDPSIPIPGGKGLGGSTLVNSAIAFSTPGRVVDEWNTDTNGAFEDVQGFYREQAGVAALLGVTATPDALLSGNDLAQRAAARRLGWSEGNLPRNTPKCSGCGRCNRGCPIGGKASMDQQVLPRAAAAGARIFPRCRVTRVGTGLVEGVVTDDSGRVIGVLKVTADAVVLAAGAISSPRLLLDSEVADTDGPVGAGLRVHPVAAAHAMLDHPVWRAGATQGHFIDEWDEDAYLLEANPIIPGGIFQVLAANGPELQEILLRSTHFVSTGAMIRDTSQGRVHKSRGAGASISYSVNDVDRDRLIQGIRKGAELWFDGADAEFVIPSVFGVPICRSMDELISATPSDLPASRLLLYASHPQASCAIGRALDATGQVIECTGVYCFDASALPSNVGRNPQISVMTVARVLATRLAIKLGGTPPPLMAPESEASESPRE